MWPDRSALPHSIQHSTAFEIERLAHERCVRLHGVVPSPRSTLARVQAWRAMRRRRRLAARLVSAGIVDPSFIGVQLNTQFSSDAEAAAAWASTEPRLHYAPHPLIEPAWIDQRSGLSRRGARRSSVGPQLALPGVRQWVDEAATVIASLTPQSVLPAAPGIAPVTLERAYGVATARAREFARQNAHSLRRHSSEWSGDDAAYALAPRGEPAARVSIVMPVRDRASVVGAAIDSILRQRFTNWELLVVDDGSTDATASIVRAYVDSDARIRLLRQDATGVSVARNRGVSEATGELMAFLDSDNTWTPDHLAAAVAAVGDGTQRAVHTVVRVRRGDGGVEFAAEQVDRESLIEGRNAVDLNALVVSSDLVRKVGGFDESLRRWVDYDLVVRLAQHVDLLLVPVVGVDYDHRLDAPDRITTRESPLWRRVVLERALVDWAALDDGSAERRSGFSVVVRSRSQWPQTLATVRHLRSLVDVVDVVVVDAASTRAETGILSLATVADPGVTIMRTAWDPGWSLSVELALAATTARDIIAVSPGALPSVVALAAAAFGARQAGSAVRTPDGHDGILLAADACSLIEARGLDLVEDPLASIE